MELRSESVEARGRETLSRLAVVALVASLPGLASCRRGTIDENVGVVPADVRGTVGGLVIDAVTGEPVAGATVTVRGGATVATATTDAAGVFVAGADDTDEDMAPELPAGGALHVEVEASSMGTPYAGAELLTSLPVAAGDIPLAAPSVAVGPIGLVPATLALVVQVVRDDGQPYQGVEVRATTAIEWVSWASGSPVGVGSYSTTEITSTGGLATFERLPDVGALPPSLSDQITFTIAAQDLDGDGFPDFEGVVTTRAARSLAAGLVLITVGSADLSLRIVSSNVPGLLSAGFAGDSVPAVIDGIDAVRIVFNQPVDPALVTVTVTDSEGNPLGASTGAPIGAGNVVLTSPPGGTWLSGAEHNVVVHAVTAGSNPPRVYDGWGAFFTLGTTPTVTVAANFDPSDGSIVRLTFSEPVGVSPGGAWSLGGASCPVFVALDLTGDGDQFDTNEAFGADSNIAVIGTETDPIGPAGISGYTTEAYFSVPAGFPGAGPVPLNLVFSRASSSGTVLRSATGVVVPDMPSVIVP